MNLLRYIELFASTAIFVGSILLGSISYRRSAISRAGAAVLIGVGVAVGGGLIIFFGFSNGDVIGSLFVAILAGLTASLTAYVIFRRPK